MIKLPVLLTGIALFFFLFVICSVQLVHADDVSSIGIATYMDVGVQVEDGDIISGTGKGYILSKITYDPQVVGVVASKPAIALKTEPNQKGVPVVNVGTVSVKVSGSNGNIKQGDYVTSSETPGVGMKAERSGYIVGQALGDVSFTDKNSVELIPISLNLHFMQIGSGINNSLWQIFSLSQMATYEEPVKVFKYVVSAIVLIMSFGFGFLIFSRAINTGLQALGRNPLAGRMIQLSIIFNVILVIIIIMSGVGIVWLFLRI